MEHPRLAGLDAEAADEVWLNNYHIEIMMWVDNHGQRPSGNVIGHTTIYGEHYAIWHGGTDFTFALDHREYKGVTHILSAIRWLTRHGKIPSNATLTQVNFGWEIPSTDGKPLDFTLAKYWLRTRR